MKNLNGLVLQTCISLTTEPLAITLDVEKQIIYWMTFTNEDNTAWLQQLDYTTEQCGTRYNIVHSACVTVHVSYCTYTEHTYITISVM